MSGNIEWVLDDVFTKRVNRSLKYFWIGFIIYTTVYAVAFAFSITSNIFQAIQFISLLLFIPAAINLIQFKIDSIYLKIIYIFYCLWMLFVIRKGVTSNLELLKYNLFNADFGIFLYLAPLAFLFPRNLAFYKKIFDVIVVLCIFYIVFDILFFRTLLNRDHSNLISQATVESFSKNLSFPVGFLLLTYNYHFKKRQLFALGVTLLMLLLAVFRARRGLISIYVVIILFSYLLYLLSTKRKFVIIFFSALIIFFMANFISQAFKKSSVFSFLVERGIEDTRTPVEECFSDDMKNKDWLMGRGINGQYFCPIVEEDGDINGYRDAIETGYLQIILNGGIISLALLLLIAFPAIVLGVFFSKNMLSKAAGFWIFIWLLSLYPANVATFSLNYLLVWISIAICYSKTVRYIPDHILKEYFKTNNHS